MIKTIKERNIKVRWISPAPDDGKKVALLIPQYNEGKNFDLEKRLVYFKKLAWENRDILDVILIDDGSSDGSLDYITKFCASNPGCFYFASVWPNSQKVGALYLVSLIVKHKYILLSDFDTDIEGLHNLESILCQCEEETDIMGCYFRMVPFDRNGVVLVFQQLEYFFDRVYYMVHKSDQSVPVMPGAGSCFKREILLKIYARHSGIRNGEDREATIIGLRFGFKAIYADSILALTRPPETFGVLLAQRKRWYLGYIETYFKEFKYYSKALFKSKSIGFHALQDILGVMLLLLLPIELILIFFMGLKPAMSILGLLYSFSVLYYYILFISNPKERVELGLKHGILIPLYPLFWLSLSSMAWWKAVLSFKKKKNKSIFKYDRYEGEGITEQDVLVRYDPAVSIVWEPFVGQIEYLDLLTNPSKPKTYNDTPFVDIHIQIDSVNRHALQNTIDFLITRHESLRTIFPLVNGEVKAVTLPFEKNLFGIIYNEVDSEDEYNNAKIQAFKKAARSVVDIGMGPLTKIFLFKVSEGDYYFHLLIHHLFMDRWSQKVVFEELQLIYRAFLEGSSPSLAPLTFQWRDFCEQENKWCRINNEKLSIYWKNKLTPFCTGLDIEPYYWRYSLRNKNFATKNDASPYKDFRSQIEVINRTEGAACFFWIGNNRLQAMKKLAQTNKSNVPAIVFAAFYILNYIYTGRKTTLLSIPIANRMVPEYQSIIGWMLGNIYLSYDVTEAASVNDIICQAFTDLGKGMSRMIYNQSMLGLDKDMLTVSTDFCVNYTFSIEPLKVNLMESEKIHLKDKDISYAFNCQLTEAPNGLFFKWKYNTDLFSQELVDDLIQCYEGILTYISKNGNCNVKDLMYFLGIKHEQVV